MTQPAALKGRGDELQFVGIDLISETVYALTTANHADLVKKDGLGKSPHYKAAVAHNHLHGTFRLVAAPVAISSAKTGTSMYELAGMTADGNNMSGVHLNAHGRAKVEAILRGLIDHKPVTAAQVNKLPTPTGCD
jgi:hypothetical protein